MEFRPLSVQFILGARRSAVNRGCNFVMKSFAEGKQKRDDDRTLGEALEWNSRPTPDCCRDRRTGRASGYSACPSQNTDDLAKVRVEPIDHADDAVPVVLGFGK